ncbi:MAG: hypothetical protein R2851_09830 [Caldilineaceae bacterium]
MVNFMQFIAQELREEMAKLGFRTVDEMIGRTDKLEARKAVAHWKAKGIDVAALLHRPDVPEHVGRYCQIEQDHGLDKSLDVQTLLDLCAPALERGEEVVATLPIKNVNRVVGAIVGSELTRRYGAQGLPEDTILLKFQGSAGQSFAAFVPKGMTMVLEGDGNDSSARGCPAARSSPTRPTVPVCAGGEHHHRQRGLLRRDCGRSLHPRHGRRALLRAQQQRQHGGRGRGRSRLHYATGSHRRLGLDGAQLRQACPAVSPMCWTRPASSPCAAIGTWFRWNPDRRRRHGRGRAHGAPSLRVYR